jgi:hypothetical protein
MTGGKKPTLPPRPKQTFAPAALPTRSAQLRNTRKARISLSCPTCLLFRIVIQDLESPLCAGIACSQTNNARANARRHRVQSTAAMRRISMRPTSCVLPRYKLRLTALSPRSMRCFCRLRTETPSLDAHKNLSVSVDGTLYSKKPAMRRIDKQ